MLNILQLYLPFTIGGFFALSDLRGFYFGQSGTACDLHEVGDTGLFSNQQKQPGQTASRCSSIGTTSWATLHIYRSRRCFLPPGQGSSDRRWRSCGCSGSASLLGLARRGCLEHFAVSRGGTG